MNAASSGRNEPAASASSANRAQQASICDSFFWACTAHKNEKISDLCIINNSSICCLDPAVGVLLDRLAALGANGGRVGGGECARHGVGGERRSEPQRVDLR